MEQKGQFSLFMLILIFALATLGSTTYNKYCQTTIDGATTTQLGTNYVQDSDEYIQLSGTQLLLDMRSQIENIGTVAYSYYLQAGDTVYHLRLVKTGVDGQPLVQKAVATTIPAATSATDALAMFLGGESGIIILEQVTGTIRFYQLSTLTFTFGGSHTFSPATQTFVKVITGGGQSQPASFYYLTKDLANSKAKLYISTIPAAFATITMAKNQSFIFACPSAFLQIDSTSINSGPIIYQTGGGGIRTATTIAGTAPTFVSSNGLNRNYDVVVIDFGNKFFVAMYDESYSSSVMFQIGDTDNTPTYAAVFDTNAQGSTLSYQTDYTSNFLQMTTDSSNIVKSIKLYFVDTYDSTSQHPQGYSSPASPSGDDATLLTDLTLGSLTNLKVSFSLVISSTGDFYFNLFILKVGASSTYIVRYRYIVTGTDSTLNLLSAGDLQKDYQMSLSTDTQNLFHSTIGNVQVMTFEIQCTCTVTTISQFICFGASLECTVAIQNLNVECTKANPGDFGITTGEH